MITMNILQVFLIYTGIALGGVFVYLNYPKTWKKNMIMRAGLMLAHFCGSVCAGLIFTEYRNIAIPWAKWIVSRWGSIYYMSNLMLCIFWGIRLGISLIYQKVMPVQRDKEKSDIWQKLTNKNKHAIIFVVLSYLMAVVGYYNIGQLHSTMYNVYIDKEATVSSLKIALISDIHA